MKKFFLFTRGRTGSTAVMDSLNKTNSIIAAQELFIKYQVKRSRRSTNNSRHLITRYDLWRKEQMGFLSIIKKTFMMSDVWIARYLDHVELSAENTGAKAFGFKVISHHLAQRPRLQDNLAKRGYSTLYLTRNLPRQVISGMVANKRGKYNAHVTENYKNDSPFSIDIDRFVSLIELEKESQINDINRIKSLGLDYKIITYEHFMSNCNQFFLDIFSFLDLEAEEVPSSLYKIMIDDLEGTITNYDQVFQTTKQLGMELI